MERVKGRAGLVDEKRRVPVNESVLTGRAPLPRGIEGTQTGRILCVRNVVTPLESGSGYVR
ncbi:MAG: hypothetical protein ACRDRT_00960 [Pseudonocardiaceae bacterium]